MGSEEKIKLVLINEQALTFRAEDYIALRTKHKIVGKLIGAAVPYPKKVSLNGLPALFTEYQTRLLIELGIVELHKRKKMTNPPSDDVKKAWEDHKEAMISEAQIPFINSKLEVVRDKMDMIIQGKKAKLIKKGVKEEDINITPEDILIDEEKRIRAIMKNSVTLYSQVPTQHPFKVTPTLIKDFPVSNLRKYKVFKDLWLKGYFITNGESFGGDFLTYYDDPFYFHAFQIVHVIDEKEKMELYFPVSCTRLAVSVKKKCVFAYVNEDDKVIYQTMAWNNPKLKEMYAEEKKKVQNESV